MNSGFNQGEPKKILPDTEKENKETKEEDNTDGNTTDNTYLFTKIDTSKVGRIYLTTTQSIPVRSKLDEKKKGEEVTGDSWREKNFAKNYSTDDELTIDIKEVVIHISNGQITTIKVFFVGDTGFFTNHGPISLTNYERNKHYPLKYHGSNETYKYTIITPADFLNYYHSGDRLYFPSKTSFKLLPKADASFKYLTYVGNPNSYFDVRAYTDTKGLSGEENGLVQTQIGANFIANSTNIGNSHFSFAKYVNLTFGWSKFDSQFDTLKISNFETRTDSDLLNILRRANTAFQIELDLFHYSRVHEASFTIGHKMWNTRLLDDSSTFKRAFTPSFYVYLGGTLFDSQRLNAKFKLPFSAAYIHDQPFVNYERNWNFFISPEIEFTLQLAKKDDNDETQQSFVFGRIRYFDMPFASGGNYWQIQTGVEIPLSDLFKKSE